MRTGPNGFSLIELMIVVTIIGILMGIALPSYQQYVYRSNRALAKTAIMKISSQQENFYNDRKAYATALTQFNVGTSVINYPANTVYLQHDGSFNSTNSGGSIYSLTLGAYTAATVANCTVSGTATTLQYAIKATPVNTQAKDKSCQSLCYGSPGDKGAVNLLGASSPDCWAR